MNISKLTPASRCLVWALVLCSTGLAAAPCDTNATPVIALSITATEVRVADRTLRIQVGPEGCVLIHRPSYFKNAGHYRLQLTTAEFTRLTQQVSPALRSTDATGLRQRIAGAERSRAVEDAASPRSFTERRFQVMDADHYVLETRIQGAAPSKLTFDGLPAYAENYPEVPELQELSHLIDELQQMAMRRDAEIATAVSP
jgi:hypothetical protein